jgi:diguanylate cyclase (GGDEF)-like protein/PAS domain S-box-containing protein
MEHPSRPTDGIRLKQNPARVIASLSSILSEMGHARDEKYLGEVTRVLAASTEAACCLLFVRSSDRRFECRYAWCDEAYSAYPERSVHLRDKDYPWWVSRLENGIIHIPDAGRLPSVATAEKARLCSAGIRACTALPFTEHGELMGYLELDFAVDPRWSDEDLVNLETLARLIAGALRMRREQGANAQFAALLDATDLGSWDWNIASGEVQLSAEAFRLLGDSPISFPATVAWLTSRMHPEDQTGFTSHLQEAIAGARKAWSVRLIRPDGVRHLRFAAESLKGPGGDVTQLIGTLRDVTEDHESRLHLERTNRALQTISACNAAMIRATSEPELLSDICRLTVERGGYALAWILLYHADGRGPTLPDAYHGDIDQAFFNVIFQALEDEKPHCLKTLSSGDPMVIPDISVSALPRRDEWLKRGFRSCVALPLKGNGRMLGVFVIHSDTVSAFAEDALKTLLELASDLSYGIGALRSRRERDEARRYLEATEQTLRKTLERDIDGVIVLDRNARILFANPAAQDMLGRPFEYLQGEPFAFPVVSGEKAEITLRRPDGTLVVAEMRSAETEWYKVPATVIAMHDVTEQRHAEEQLRIWATVLERSGELIFVTDAQRRIIAVNRAFQAITGYTADEALGRDPHFLASGLEDKTFYREMWREINETGHWQGEIRDRRKSGEVLPLWLAVTSAGETQENRHFIAIGLDMSERKAAEERIQFLAFHDPLTGLPNRILFKDRLMLAAVHAQRANLRMAVLFLDLDRFKNINDSLGHDAGDELLQQVSDRIVGCVRRDDTVSRQGGDEFLILLCLVREPQDAAQVAGKILEELALPYDVSGTEVHISGSIGIAMFPEDGIDPETLVRNADAAMYYAKERGRNNYQFFVADLNQRISERLSMETALRHALERGEFELYYQPQINVLTNELEGVEALLRWRHEGSLIEPKIFVPLAEETGLIIPIGEWVMREACRQADDWRRAGMPAVRVAINLSAAQFRQRGAFERLREILTEGCDDPHSLEMELTEGTFMQEAESSLHTLRALKDTGVGLAIDDFGTGYSNLNYLRRFPVDRIKVDQSFVRDLATDPIDRAVTEAIIALARSLHVDVVAEGVETDEERRLLEERDCKVFQGFLFARPLPAAAMTAWWRAHLQGAG